MKLFPTKDERELKKFYNYVTEFREKYIPKKYNQCELLYDLPKQDVTHYVSISNRTDGKSINYIHFFIRFAIDYGVNFALICRHWTLRNAMQTQIVEIYEMFDDLKYEELVFKAIDQYVIVYNKNVQIGIIYDLNKASDLKLFSNTLKRFPIIIYDEFLALEGDYITDEYGKIKTIYRSVDRSEPWKIIGHPVIFYLGNAVNFSSPILSGLNLFNKLENHEMNTKKIYGKIALENRFNEEINDERNLDAFDDDANDAMATGQFKVNDFNIATESQRKAIDFHKASFYVKLAHNYLKVVYNRQTFDCYLAITSLLPPEEDYSFNLHVKDNTDYSCYLKETFKDIEHIDKYAKGLFLFDNAFSKNEITSRPELYELKINKMIDYHQSEHEPDTVEEKEKLLKDNYLEQTKKRIAEKFLRGF